jgi:peptidylprolyl isomerase
MLGKTLLVAGLLIGLATPAPASPAPSMAQILAQSPPGDWRPVDPENTLYLNLAQGRVIIELSPIFAPNHVANIKRLVRAGFFDGLAIVRSQDDYVVQWGDAEAKRPLGGAQRALKAEFDRAYGAAEPFAPLPDPDTYAAQVGFAGGFPAARDPRSHRTWLTHCYGMVGAGRDNDADSGSGAELYAVIGQAPRQLDRNVTLVGRVVEGIDVLAAMPRGHGDLGFYQTAAERTPIISIKMAADLPPGERVKLQALRTDSPTFAALIHNRRFRKDDWYKTPAGRIDVCNMPLPMREARN